MGRSISDRMSDINHYMCSGKATSLKLKKKIFVISKSREGEYLSIMTTVTVPKLIFIKSMHETLISLALPTVFIVNICNV